MVSGVPPQVSVGSAEGAGPASPSEIQGRLKSLAYGLEFSKRCATAKTLEDLSSLLVNDIGVFVEFDRSFLVLHAGGASELVAIGGSPMTEGNTLFHEEAERLASRLISVNKGFLISGVVNSDALKEQGLPEDSIASLESFVQYSKCAHLFCIPLIQEGHPLGHLILEFFGNSQPDEKGIMVLLGLSPILASLMARCWLLDRDPDLVTEFTPDGGRRARLWRRVRRVVLLAILSAGAYGLLVLAPVPVHVGGETEIVPANRHFAFCQIDGLVESVLVAEGDRVEESQVLAKIDSRELSHDIQNARSQVEILGSEMAYLQRSAAQGQSEKLAERDLLVLKLEGLKAQLAYYQALEPFLEVRSPVAGTLVTKDIESLAGKKLRAGELFCEILGDGELAVDILVPEDRISWIQVDKQMTLYSSVESSLFAKGLDLWVRTLALGHCCLRRYEIQM